jgi:hypothetical protein
LIPLLLVCLNRFLFTAAIAARPLKPMTLKRSCSLALFPMRSFVLLLLFSLFLSPIVGSLSAQAPNWTRQKLKQVLAITGDADQYGSEIPVTPAPRYATFVDTDDNRLFQFESGAWNYVTTIPRYQEVGSDDWSNIFRAQLQTVSSDKEQQFGVPRNIGVQTLQAVKEDFASLSIQIFADPILTGLTSDESDRLFDTLRARYGDGTKDWFDYETNLNSFAIDNVIRDYSNRRLLLRIVEATQLNIVHKIHYDHGATGRATLPEIASHIDYLASYLA